MEKKYKIRIVLILFLAAAVSAMFFVLSHPDADKITVYYDNKDNDKIIENNQANNKISEDGTEKDNPKKIDWQPVIEKWRGKEVSQIKTDRKVIALTFDGGANADGAERILEILKENDIEGTFFLTGKFIEKFPNETKMIVDSGGDIGNHSYSHPYFTKLTDKEIKVELEKTETELSRLNAVFEPFFRFPYGDRNKETISAINDKNYISIRWTVDSLGWEGSSGGMTKETVRNKVLSKAAPGVIILMHLGTNPEDKTQLDSEALPEIISELKQQGYEFATIMEMLEINSL